MSTKGALSRYSPFLPIAFAFVGVLTLTVIGLSEQSAIPHASASAHPSTCSLGQLEVGVLNQNGADSAAGNEGIAYVVVNISKTLCSLEGYPEITTYPSTYEKRTMKITHGGGQIFEDVRVQLLYIEPGDTASFGLNYGDAANQRDPSAGPCMTQSVTISFPNRLQPKSGGYTVPTNLNFCYAGFRGTSTSLQSGPLPRRN